MFDGLRDGEPADAALGELLLLLREANYRFVAPTPATHSLVSQRRQEARPGDLRDVFGWRRRFRAGDLAPHLVDLLSTAGALETLGRDAFRSQLRVSSLGGRLFIHSPSGSGLSEVFLGPDSYRFAGFLDRAVQAPPHHGRFFDVGAGAGVGAITLAARHPEAEVVAGDVNPEALRLTAVNARAAGVEVRTVIGPGLSAVQGDFDVIVANPPYIAGNGGRTYRDGGDDLGTKLALDWMTEAVRRLRPAGTIVLYTGSPIVEGEDRVRRAMVGLSNAIGGTLDYEELDPDVFGGTLRREAYATVERIAAVGAVLRAPA